MTVAIGQRNYLVGIEQLTESTGDSGFPIESFTPLPPATWMQRTAVTSTRGGQVFVADQIASKVVTEWVLPYRPDMDPDLVDVMKRRRLVLSGWVHDIVEASLIGTRDQIRLVTHRQQQAS